MSANAGATSCSSGTSGSTGRNAAHGPDGSTSETEAQLTERPEVAQAFPQQAVALSGATGGEHEGDLRSAEGTTPHKQLEQSLEPAGSERVQVDGIRPDKEESAHRTGDVVKAPREQHPRRGGRAVDISPADQPEPFAASLLAVPAGHHQVGSVAVRLREQLQDALGGMLRVCVHDTSPGCAAGHAGAVDDGPWQAGRSLSALSADE
jgi:hypothetical protein